MRLNSWQSNILVGFVLVALAFGAVLLVFSHKIPKALADWTVSDRYYLPPGVKSGAVASRDRLQQRLALPGSTVTVTISGRSTQYRYEVLAAASSPPNPPAWMNGGTIVLDQAPHPTWARSVTAAGNQDPTKRDAICDFFINGQFTHQGPCKVDSTGAKLYIKIADDEKLVGKYLGVAFRTETGDRTLSWRVTGPDQSEWIKNEANFGGLSILVGIFLICGAAAVMYLVESGRIIIEDD